MAAIFAFGRMEGDARYRFEDGTGKCDMSGATKEANDTIGQASSLIKPYDLLLFLPQGADVVRDAIKL